MLTTKMVSSTGKTSLRAFFPVSSGEIKAVVDLIVYCVGNSSSDSMASADRPQIRYDNGASLTARGSDALHEHVASLMEKALGKPLPQMEVRFRDVSISADIAVKDEANSQCELPTLSNDVIKFFRGLTSSKHTVKKWILEKVSGAFKPGTATLVLGQPGSGKSSLMKLLSGRFPQVGNVVIDDKVTYNGTLGSELQRHLPQLVSYVGQQDIHYPSLTVEETLEFAHTCCSGGLRRSDGDNLEAREALKNVFKHYPDVILHQLGLVDCKNTVLGDAMTRGVSGGERKRVTTGEMAFGNKLVLMLDEISTGLDSAATFDIIKTQCSLAKHFGKTVVISLLQPSPEVFALFDSVMLLNEGQVIYHGPREEALGYFERLGFNCPPERDVADFLMDLGTNKQSGYEVEALRAKGIPRTAAQFADAFTRSNMHTQTMEYLTSSTPPALVNYQERLIAGTLEYQQTFWRSTMTVARRQATLLVRDKAFLSGRVFMMVFMGFLYATVFFQVNEMNAQLVMGIAFNEVVFMSLGQQSQIPVIIAARDVFYKQRRANFFRTASFVVSNLVSQIPVALMEAVCFGTFLYWMCGFVATAGTFLLYELVLFLTSMAFSAFFFFLSCASPNLNFASPIASFCVMLFTLFSGFNITKDQIPDYLIWVFWINPMAWSVRAVVVNEYTASRFDICTFGGVDYCGNFGMTLGEYLLSTFSVPTEKFWLWYGMVFMAATYISFMFLSYVALEFHRYESPENVVLDSIKTKDEIVGGYNLSRTPRSSPTESDAILEVEAKEQHFVPVTIAFNDLWYTVPDPTNPKDTIDLLKGISGYALPGTMTALMGSSGAGKTTLMDVIAGRKTGGKIRGEILLNGYPATDLAIRRSTGYCEQMDIHSESSTIREALTFSAFLRQGADIPDSYKYDSVNECLELLDLNPIADQIIRGSSVEQMKRLTIGVELAAQPSVIFLDEPTSGLDARSAKVIMDGVRKVANTGRTIVCTIHQPSSAVFRVFDNLLLLKRGGETVFAGELGKHAHKMIEYFEAIPGVTKLQDNYNPATWMLEVIGAGVGNSNGDKTDFVELFKSSGEFQYLQANLDRDGVTRPSESLPELQYGDKRAATDYTQMVFLLQRFSNMYWRTASYNLTRFCISLILALIFCITYTKADYSTYTGVNSGMGMLSTTTGFMGFIALCGVIPIAFQDRLAFYRERSSQTYNALWYFVGMTVVEIPYVFFSTLLFVAPFYPLVGFTGFVDFLAYWLYLSMTVLWHVYLGQLVSFAMPTVETATLVAVMLQTIFFLFNGFNPPASSVPRAYKWLFDISPLKYSQALVSALVFGKCSSSSDIGCQVMVNSPPSLSEGITVKEYLSTVFMMKRSDALQNCGAVLIAMVVFKVLGLLSLRFINHQKK